MSIITNSIVKALVITKRFFVITYIAYLRQELVIENIITQSQSNQISDYIQKQLKQHGEEKAKKGDHSKKGSKEKTLTKKNKKVKG